jgi:hypothetical protein
MKQKLKYIRVDPKTVICVRADIPDQTAVSEYRLKLDANERKYEHYPNRKRWQ